MEPRRSLTNGTGRFVIHKVLMSLSEHFGEKRDMEIIEASSEIPISVPDVE